MRTGHCTMYDVQRNMYNVQCTMYTVQCTLYTEHHTLHPNRGRAYSNTISKYYNPNSEPNLSSRVMHYGSSEFQTSTLKSKEFLITTLVESISYCGGMYSILTSFIIEQA